MPLLARASSSPATRSPFTVAFAVSHASCGDRVLSSSIKYGRATQRAHLQAFIVSHEALHLGLPRMLLLPPNSTTRGQTAVLAKRRACITARTNRSPWAISQAMSLCRLNRSKSARLGLAPARALDTLNPCPAQKGTSVLQPKSF